MQASISKELTVIFNCNGKCTIRMQFRKMGKKKGGGEVDIKRKGKDMGEKGGECTQLGEFQPIYIPPPHRPALRISIPKRLLQKFKKE
jgi:hypothetical protein